MNELINDVMCKLGGQTEVVARLRGIAGTVHAVSRVDSWSLLSAVYQHLLIQHHQ